MREEGFGCGDERNRQMLEVKALRGELFTVFILPTLMLDINTPGVIKYQSEQQVFYAEIFIYRQCSQRAWVYIRDQVICSGCPSV